MRDGDAHAPMQAAGIGRPSWPDSHPAGRRASSRSGAAISFGADGGAPPAVTPSRPRGGHADRT
ncbi:hypothetical protein [Burkholderia pseudomallei]|uniref:hypothetical protein n=1 Tax=Burkholderia pseudomallei TaxID=28450 RepID=UPI0022D96F84|nr:hypothetical protein [Burkholderia pseudomallei]MDA0559315.1 hypothetical protein [Burkholderia pseudomallei]